MRISDWSSDVCSSDLPDAIIDIAAGIIVPAEWRGRFGLGIVRSRQVGRTANSFGQEHVDRLQCHLARLAGSDLLRFGQQSVDIVGQRSEEQTSELQSLLRISYAVFCLKKKKTRNH